MLKELEEGDDSRLIHTRLISKRVVIAEPALAYVDQFPDRYAREQALDVVADQHLIILKHNVIELLDELSRVLEGATRRSHQRPQD